VARDRSGCTPVNRFEETVFVGRQWRAMRKHDALSHSPGGGTIAPLATKPFTTTRAYAGTRSILTNYTPGGRYLRVINYMHRLHVPAGFVFSP